MPNTLLIEHENVFLKQENAAHLAAIAEHLARIDQKEILLSEKETIISENEIRISKMSTRLRVLEELLASMKQRQFGASSEKVSPDQGALFNEAEAEPEIVSENDAAVTILAHQRRASKRLSIPAELPREDIIHDLPAEQKICPHDGTALKHIGHESHEQLDIIPAQIKVLRHLRLKYACPCCERYVVTAAKPAQPIEKSIASPGLLSTVATQKYVDGLPLYRQTELFQRIGIALDRTTLANWMVKCGQLIQPLINLQHEKMLEQTFLHMDETPVQVLNEPGKSAQSQSYMWLLRSTQTPAVLFHYAPSRSAKVPTHLLRDFSGALMVDGYEGYHSVCVQNAIQRLGCWAHARRKFVEAQKVQAKNKTGKADQALVWIQQLYRIEQDIKTQTAEEKLIARQQHSQPIIDKLKLWLEKSLPHVPPQTAIGKALQYLHHQWPRLIGYLENGAYPIDNNPAENAIRPFVIGRKNWLFSSSQAGAQASANLYSLIETAKANGLEPAAYLKKVFTDLPNARSVEEVEALLPWNVKGGVG